MFQSFWNAVAAVTEVWTKLPHYLYEYQMLVYITAVLLIVGAVGYYVLNSKKIARRRLFSIQRGRKMTRAERQQYIRDLVGDKICDVIEELEFNGKISRPEARTIYRRLGQVLTIKALLPAKKRKALPSVEELRMIRKTLFGEKPVNIPGPKPGEGDNLIPFPKYLSTPPAATAQPGRKKLGAAYSARKAASA